MVMDYFRSFIRALCIWDIPHQNRKKRIGLDSSDRVHHHLFYCYTSLCLLLPVADLRILKRIIESVYIRGSLILRITGLFVSLAVAIYLWFDAPKHNKDKWLWAILGVLFSTIVLGIYLIKTERKGLGWTILILTILFYLMLLISVLIGVILFYQVSPS